MQFRIHSNDIYCFLVILTVYVTFCSHDCVQCKLVIIYFDVYWIVKLASVAADKVHQTVFLNFNSIFVFHLSAVGNQVSSLTNLASVC